MLCPWTILLYCSMIYMRDILCVFCYYCPYVIWREDLLMVDVSGHLRNERRAIGYIDTVNSIVVNCCGWQIFRSKDYIQNREKGRLDYQIIYVYKGTGHYFLNGQWVSVSAGNILLFCPGEPQVYSYYANEMPEIYWIHFTGTKSQELIEEYHIQNSYIGENSVLKNLFQDIIIELQLKKALYEDIVINSFYKMLMTISRSRQQLLMPSENNFSIERLIIQLNQRYMDKWTVSSMADYCKLSESYFSHTFKKHTGVSPMHFLNDLRIEKAKDLLSSNTMNIATIAELVGYDDPLYFSRAFKKIAGTAPQNFLKNDLMMNTPEWYQEDK